MSLRTSGITVHPRLRDYCKRGQIPEKTVQRIIDLKRELGPSLFFVAHQYQRPEICYLADFIGDSYALAVRASQSAARYILFSGVRFMAESSAAMARADQVVLHPRPLSGCPLASDIDAVDFATALERVETANPERRVVPFTYMNSDLETKALVGEKGGAVVTSSNAAKILGQEFQRGSIVFFVPDKNLGLNIALRELGLTRGEITVWNPRNLRRIDEGGLQKPLHLWDGRCRIHADRFTAEDVERVRARYPSAKVVVHPECTPEVVNLADANGSTGFIVSYAQQATADAPVFVGTETNLVGRIHFENPHIYALGQALCGNMFAITLELILNTLAGIASGNFINVVKAEPELAKGANLALQRMITWAAD